MSTPANNALHSELPVPRDAAPPLCPVDRLPLRRRNRICIRIITLGMLNFLVYTVFYAALGGDAHNGERRTVQQDEGAQRSAYFVRGHHISSLTGREREVSRTLWIYSYIHSISVLLTSCAMIISMLVLARPHIIATMRDGAIAGQTFVTVFGTVVVLITSFAVVLFVWNFVTQLAGG
jgi:hypothetical protein